MALAACVTQPPKQLPFHPPSTEDPRDLSLHIIEVDNDGEGDDVDISKIKKIENNNYGRYQVAVPTCAKADEEAEKRFSDDEIVVREQFVCVMENAIRKYKQWSERDVTGEWPCGGGENRPLCLAFYFNGGLNSASSAMQTAGKTYRQIEYDNIYPVYMVWPTGAVESYWEDWTRVRAGRLTNWDDPLTLASSPVRPVSDLLRGVASAPAAWGTSTFEFYQTGFGFGSQAYAMKRDWELHVSKGQPITTEQAIGPDRNLYFSPWEQAVPTPTAEAPPEGDPVADLVFKDDASQNVREVAGFAYYGATSPVRVVTTLPMVGLGEAGWRNMVRRTRTSVRSATEFPDEFARQARGPEDPEQARGRLAEAQEADGPDSVRIAPVTVGCDRPLQGDAAKLRRCYPRGSGAFARVFQWLESCITGRELGVGADPCPLRLNTKDGEILSNARILMIGHSMGTIVVNELLQLFPDLPYESLVYMAGAASVGETSRAVTPVLTRNRGCTRFYGLMLHPMNEAREATGWGLLPSGSLLVYVDEFLEVPKTVPDRTVGQWRNLRATRHVFFPEEARRWMLFHVFDRAQRNGAMPNPTSHGSFNDEGVPFWQEAFWKPDQVKFPAPEADCDDVFGGRLHPAVKEAGAGVTGTFAIPAEEMAQMWDTVRREVEAGQTVAITSGGRPMARIVPVARGE